MPKQGLDLRRVVLRQEAAVVLQAPLLETAAHSWPLDEGEPGDSGHGRRPLGVKGGGGWGRIMP